MQTLAEDSAISGSFLGWLAWPNAVGRSGEEAIQTAPFPLSLEVEHLPEATDLMSHLIITWCMLGYRAAGTPASTQGRSTHSRAREQQGSGKVFITVEVCSVLVLSYYYSNAGIYVS